MAGLAVRHRWPLVFYGQPVVWVGGTFPKVRVWSDEEPRLVLRENEPSESGPGTSSSSLLSSGLVPGRLWQIDIPVWEALLSPVSVLPPPAYQPWSLSPRWQMTG